MARYTAASIAFRISLNFALLSILLSSYVFLVRPRQLRWGATDAELAVPMPEDSVVQHPDFDATRAITIRARPAEIWPWIVQMGYGRAGFYGYDLIENFGSESGIRSASCIEANLQHPRSGDALPLSAVATLRFTTIEKDRALVWSGMESPPAGVFIWQLVPVDGTHTRLISRIRWRYLSTWRGKVLGAFTEFADHVAVRAILRGIRDRVEHQPLRSLGNQAVELAAWFLTTSAFVLSIILVLVRQRWGVAWLLGLGSGLLLQYELYLSPGAVYSAGCTGFYLAAMAWALRRGSLAHRNRLSADAG